MQGSSDGAYECGYARGKGVALTCELAPHTDHEHVNDAPCQQQACMLPAHCLPSREGLDAKDSGSAEKVQHYLDA